jgi:hypothetical protein
MPTFEVIADITISRTIGVYEAETEEEAIKLAEDDIKRKLLDEFDLEDAENVWAEEVRGE